MTTKYREQPTTIRGWVFEPCCTLDSCTFSCADGNNLSSLQLGVEDLCQAVEGNFLSMPFPEASFDGAYAIEATCHADKVSCKMLLRYCSATNATSDIFSNSH